MNYDNFKVGNYPKSLISPEFFGRHLSRLFAGDVLDGLTVTPGSGMQVTLAPGNSFLRYGSSAVASARFLSLVANFNLAIGTADVSNPRIDLVVVYVDNSVSLPGGTPTEANLDGPGVGKAKIVQGTPAASPSVPTAVAIQASVGAGNPYTVVAQVRVDAGVSVIAANKITDVRNLAKLTPDKIDFAKLRLGKSTITAIATSTAALASPSEVDGLAVTFTLTETRTVRASLLTQSWYNSGANYNRIFITNGPVSTANAIGMTSAAFSGANQELPCPLVAEATLPAGTYTFRVGMGRNTGTASLSASTTYPTSMTVDVVG